MTIKEFKMQYALGLISMDVLEELASGSNTSESLLDYLVVLHNTICNIDITCAIARNSNTSVKTLEKLSKFEESTIRCNVACNVRASEEILEKLSNDINWRVRQHITINYKAPLVILKKLYEEDKIKKLNVSRLKIFKRDY